MLTNEDAALAADAAYHEELVRVYGLKNAGDAHYDKRGEATPKLRELSLAKRMADEAQRLAEHDGMPCEPCGECRWCESNFKAKAEVKRLRRRVRSLEKALRGALNEIALELQACSPDEVRQNVMLRAKQVRGQRWEKLLSHLPQG